MSIVSPPLAQICSDTKQPLPLFLPPFLPSCAGKDSPHMILHEDPTNDPSSLATPLYHHIVLPPDKP